MSVNFSMLAIRPNKIQVERIEELEKFLVNNNLMILHKENHIYILNRSDGKELATTTIL